MLGEENQCKGDDYLGQVFSIFRISQTLTNIMIIFNLKKNNAENFYWPNENKVGRSIFFEKNLR